MTHNLQITPNFSLKEFMCGTALPKEAIELNYKHFDDSKLDKVKGILNIAQIIRDAAKEKFGKRFQGFTITAGLRVLEWELKQGRSGKGQHPQYTAIDIQPICADADYMEIFNWVFNTFSANFVGGFAKKEPDLKNGKKGFIHIDNRGVKARWTY